jgi:cation diffusion facilitator CzcD-associated flavoprotein CzcO
LTFERLEGVEYGMPESTANSRSLRFVIIGAGLSGIMSAIKLAEAGYRDVTIYEKADRPGGTWRENTYPGVACDIPSHLYSYSFAPNPEWSRRYSPGHEIQAYLTAVARRFDVESRIRFSDEVERCERIDGRWHILTKRGHHDVADVVIAATGVTHHPNQPELPGLSTFAGPSFHSARWDHSVPLDGRRIGVIGSSSTAVQIVSALAERVSKLVLFQRTAQWILPQENPAYGAAEKAQFTQQPALMQSLRAEIARRFTDNFSNAVVSPGSPALKAIEEACRLNLESQVRDPVLREKLRPSYQAACKRLIVSFDFYQAVQKPAVEVVTDGIETVEAAGVRTRDGRLHELDLLVLATGFRVDRFLRPIEVIGRDGLSLSDAWAQRPQAYLSVAIPRFPNLFMLNGPNGPVGNFSLIEVAELQMKYILQLVELLRAGTCREVSPTPEHTARFEAERVEATKNTVWASGCKSWYLDDRGVPSAWPWTIDRFRAEMSAPKLEAYEQVG